MSPSLICWTANLKPKANITGREEEDWRLDELRAYGAGASSSLVPGGTNMASGAKDALETLPHNPPLAEILLESQTLPITPLATEVFHGDTLSAPVTIGATDDVPGDNAPQLHVPDTQA
ncbi:hypothetical protein HAX54_034560 [Datura stramonium]|uniref:Uncharacterized protein n=1 Tax=Datura stramonium TaxID=4076 RepID=A0ABS8SEB1_DATST|nr:hypothetical protein [Datura stramonium]